MSKKEKYRKKRQDQRYLLMVIEKTTALVSKMIELAEIKKSKLPKYFASGGFVPNEKKEEFVYVLGKEPNLNEYELKHAADNFKIMSSPINDENGIRTEYEHWIKDIIK